MGKMANQDAIQILINKAHNLYLNYLRGGDPDQMSALELATYMRAKESRDAYLVAIAALEEKEAREARSKEEEQQ